MGIGNIAPSGFMFEGWRSMEAGKKQHTTPNTKTDARAPHGNHPRRNGRRYVGCAALQRVGWGARNEPQQAGIGNIGPSGFVFVCVVRLQGQRFEIFVNVF